MSVTYSPYGKMSTIIASQGLRPASSNEISDYILQRQLVRRISTVTPLDIAEFRGINLYINSPLIEDRISYIKNKILSMSTKRLLGAMDLLDEAGPIIAMRFINFNRPILPPHKVKDDNGSIYAGVKRDKFLSPADVPENIVTKIQAEYMLTGKTYQYFMNTYGINNKATVATILNKIGNKNVQ